MTLRGLLEHNHWNEGALFQNNDIQNAMKISRNKAMQEIIRHYLISIVMTFITISLLWFIYVLHGSRDMLIAILICSLPLVSLLFHIFRHLHVLNNLDFSQNVVAGLRNIVEYRSGILHWNSGYLRMISTFAFLGGYIIGAVLAGSSSLIDKLQSPKSILLFIVMGIVFYVLSGRFKAMSILGFQREYRDALDTLRRQLSELETV